MRNDGDFGRTERERKARFDETLSVTCLSPPRHFVVGGAREAKRGGRDPEGAQGVGTEGPREDKPQSSPKFV